MNKKILLSVLLGFSSPVIAEDVKVSPQLQSQVKKIAQRVCEESGYKLGFVSVEDDYDNILLEETGRKNMRLSCLYPGSENEYPYEPPNPLVFEKTGICEYAQTDWTTGTSENPTETVCYHVNFKILSQITQ